MFSHHMGSTRAALLIEHIEPDGERKIIVYYLSHPITLTTEEEFSATYNVFDKVPRYTTNPVRISVDAYLAAEPQEWDGKMPQQEEVEPVRMAIQSSESDIVVDEDDFEQWQSED